MLNDELKPNFAELLRTSANLSAPTAGLGAEFCSCVESVLAIGHLQLQKGVVRAQSIFKRIVLSQIRYLSDLINIKIRISFHDDVQVMNPAKQST